MKALLAPPLPKKAKEDLISCTFWPLALVLSRFFFFLLSSLLWPRHRSRARRTYPYLYWVSTLDERPALGVLIVSIHFGQKSCSGALAYGEAYTISTVSPMECLKHQCNLAFISLHLAATPEESPTTAASYRPQGV